jgi:hypothetical protein
MLSVKQQIYIVEIAESINIQDIGETRCKTKILGEAREHVPWIALGSYFERRESIIMYLTHI